MFAFCVCECVGFRAATLKLRYYVCYLETLMLKMVVTENILTKNLSVENVDSMSAFDCSLILIGCDMFLKQYMFFQNMQSLFSKLYYTFLLVFFNINFSN